MTDTRIYQGDLEARPPDRDQPDSDQAGHLESLVAEELRDGETDDPNEAAEEGLTWIPPTDPPITVDERGNAEGAAGFGTSAADEPFDADHHGEPLYAQDEVEARVLDALRASAETTHLVDSLEVDAEGTRVAIAGIVDDLDDEDAVVAVAESVAGVDEVHSQIVVRAVENAAVDPEGRPTP